MDGTELLFLLNFLFLNESSAWACNEMKSYTSATFSQGSEVKLDTSAVQLVSHTGSMRASRDLSCSIACSSLSCFRISGST